MRYKKLDKMPIILSFIIGFLFVTFIYFYMPGARATVEGKKATKEDYSNLKHYSLEVASGKQVKNKDLQIEKKIEDGVLYIHMEDSMKLCGVESKFPMINKNIDFKNAEFIEYSVDWSKVEVLIILIVVFALIVLSGYLYSYMEN